ncbi:MAG: nucleotidyltransferase family protein [Nitrolancea sp.]
MTRDELVRILGEHRSELDALGVQSLALFGSMARDEAGPESDVDFLVEFNDLPTFDRYMGLKLLLEDVLGRRVDLVLREDLKPRIRDRILGEAIPAA